MTTESNNRKSKRTDEPGTPATQPFTPDVGGTPVSATGTVTTSYNIALYDNGGKAAYQVTAEGLLPDAVFIGLYNGPVGNDKLLSWNWVEVNPVTLPTAYFWSSGYYVGLSQKTYSGGDSSYTLICSAGPT